MSKVRQEMTRKVAFVLESDDLARAHDSMKALDVRHVPVTRNGEVVGILSDRDILFHSRAGDKGRVIVPKKRVSDVMSAPVIVCRVEDSIGAIAETMIEKKIDALPVVDSNQRLVGIITSTDLLRLLKDKDWEIQKPLPFHFEQHRLGEEAVC